MKQLQSKHIGFGTLILLALILAFSPVDKMSKTAVPAEKLLDELQHENTYIQPDELAHWIIDKDPGFQLVDIRSDADYEKYNIPGNMHIPFERLSDDDELSQLDPEKMIILASNGNTRAGQAWLLLRQKGYSDVYVLAGGLNNWVAIFSNPQKPDQTATDDELFTYQFRKAAGPVVMGAKLNVENAAQSRSQTKPAPVKRKRRTVKKKVDEGC